MTGLHFPIPAPRYNSSSRITVPLQRLSQIRLVFTARTEDDASRELIVKFEYGRYRIDAHKAAAQADLAPALLSYNPDLLGGCGWVVMKMLEDDFTPYDGFDRFFKPCVDTIKEALSEINLVSFMGIFMIRAVPPAFLRLCQRRRRSLGMPVYRF
ncbi:hypothetical protein BDP27DRAFT_401725 [Rhodocollybia butyracea]|uniref:Uncharacterized protein n=1 Tax=Rhodocollybia butyracea TaxID=206335 RepID=A0A9P5TZW1_9AGAR|nr:hypothetical protein BDP27DRAFT_401725 [Rhodocollybia butyracea]